MSVSLEGEMGLLKGEDIETKLRHAEVILERLLRGSNVSKQTIVLSPQIFSAAHDVIEPGGALIRFMLPIDGTIEACIFEVGSVQRDDDKKIAQFEITIDDGQTASVQRINAKVGRDGMTVGVSFSAGTKVSVVAMTKVTDVWLALTFVPTVGKSISRRIQLEMEKEASDAGVLSNI